MRHFTFRLLVIALGSIFNSHICEAQPGFLDPTFGNSGKLMLDFFGESDEANDVVIQPDGKIIVTGSVVENFVTKCFLVRLNSDGSFDTSFGNNGRVIYQYGQNQVSSISDVELLSDGRILVAGNTFANFVNQVGMARFNSDGSFDTSFSSDGMHTYSPGASFYCNALGIQVDGTIMVAGSSTILGPSHITLMRFTTTGTIDNSFGGGDGVVVTQLNEDSGALGMAINSDYTISIAGRSGDGLYSDAVVLRYQYTGALDNSFDSDGIKTIVLDAYDDYASELVLMSNGKMLISCTSNTDFALIRLNSNGSFDNTFSGDGIVRTDMSDSFDELYDLAIDANGKIVAAGFSGYNLYDAAVLRYNSNGTLDNLFSIDGKVTVDFIGSYDYTWGIALQPDGKIVVVGTTDNSGQNDATIFRLQDVCPAISFSQEVSICAGESIVVDGHQYTTAGVYNDQITLATGCDSSITTILNVLPHSSFTQDVTINAGESLSVGNNTYTSSGTYEDVLVAANGCDSVLTTILTVLVGIDDIGLQHELVQVRPVPFEDILIIEGIQSKDVIELTDISGKLIMRVEAKDVQMNLNTSELHSGMYWLIQRNNERLKVRKVMKLN